MENTAQEKIEQMSQIEQSLHQFLRQRQNFQNQYMEIESALIEIEKSPVAYRIVGNVMVKKNKEEIKRSLEKDKEKLDLRIKTIQSQEDRLKEKAKKLQSEVMDEMKLKGN